MSNYCCIKNLKFCFLQIFEIVHWKHLVVSDDVVGDNDLLFLLVSAFLVLSLVCFFAKENIPGFPWTSGRRSVVGAQDDGEDIIGILKDGVGSLGAAAVLGVVVAGAGGDDKHTIVWAGNDAVDEIVVTTQLLEHPIPAAAARARANCICRLQVADCICRLQVAGAGCRSGWCGEGQVN